MMQLQGFVVLICSGTIRNVSALVYINTPLQKFKVSFEGFVQSLEIFRKEQYAEESPLTNLSVFLINIGLVTFTLF